MSEFAYECIQCKKTFVFDLDPNDVARWKTGALIQNVFPQLSNAERELMISGLCGECFDKLFPDD